MTISSRLTLYLNIILAVVVLLTIVFAIPYTVSAFYLFQAAAALEKATQEAHIDARVLQTAPFNVQLPATEVSDSPFLHQAVTALQSAVRWDSNNTQAYRLLVNLYLLQENYQGANELLQKFSASHPDDQIAHRRLGDTYAMLDKLGLALREWEKAGLNVRPEWYPLLSRGEAVRITIQDMQTNQGRPIEEDQGTVMVLFTVGDIGADLFFPRTGEYQIRIHAKNSIPGPVICEVRLDDVPVGTVVWELNDDSYTDRDLIFKSHWGVRRLQVVFMNDEVSSKGDRNAYFQWFEVRAAPELR